MVTILESTKLLAEGAGAAGVAAAASMRAKLSGKKVGCVLSGGNVTMAGLQQALDEERPW
jgi:threonine dehydratase